MQTGRSGTGVPSAERYGLPRRGLSELLCVLLSRYKANKPPDRTQPVPGRLLQARQGVRACQVSSVLFIATTADPLFQVDVSRESAQLAIHNKIGRLGFRCVLLGSVHLCATALRDSVGRVGAG